MNRDDYGEAYQQGFNITVRFLVSRGAKAEGALEIAQSAWVRGWEKIEQLRDDNMVSTWVNSIALNCYRKWFKQQSRWQELTDQPSGESPNFAALDTQRVLSFIPASDRLILERRVHGASINQIAMENNVSNTAIRLRLLRARRHARFQAERSHTLWRQVAR